MPGMEKSERRKIHKGMEWEKRNAEFRMMKFHRDI